MINKLRWGIYPRMSPSKMFCLCMLQCFLYEGKAIKTLVAKGDMLWSHNFCIFHDFLFLLIYHLWIFHLRTYEFDIAHVSFTLCLCLSLSLSYVCLSVCMSLYICLSSVSMSILIFHKKFVTIILCLSQIVMLLHIYY